MVIRRPSYNYSPSRDLVTETVRVGLPLDAKRALTEVARREGRSVSAVVREAVETVIERDSAVPQPLVPGARR